MKLDSESRPRLIALLKTEQHRRKLSLNAFAKAIDIQPSWLSRFYNSKDNDPDTKILDKIAEKLGFNEGSDELIGEANRRFKVSYEDLSVGCGLSIWALPLYLAILEDKLPNGVECVCALASTPTTENITPEELQIRTSIDLSKMFDQVSASDRLRRSLTANDMLELLSDEIQHFDMAIIPASLRNKLELNSIYQLATLAKGYGVFLYFISPKGGNTRWQYSDNNDQKPIQNREALQNLIESNINEISHVVLLPQTAAYQHWDTFCDGLYEQNKAVWSKLADKIIEYKNTESYSLKSDRTVILCAFEPFANTFYHAFFGEGYEYVCINLSEVIDQKIEMTILSNQVTLGNVEKLKTMFSLLETLKKVKPTSESGNWSKTKLGLMAKAMFVESASDDLPIDRLHRSIKDMDFTLTETELARFLYKSINPN